MKKTVLLLFTMLMMVSTAEATKDTKNNSTKDYDRYFGARTIQFNERGIKFYVFADGSIDFNTHTRHTTRYYYRNGRRYAKRMPTTGVRIRRDYRGRVRSVGNVFINYNRLGKVTRIGSVFIDYQRDRRMTRIGGMRIKYDRFGNVRYFGSIKPNYRFYNGFNDFYSDVTYDYFDDVFYEDDFYNDYEEYDQDDNFYYYKTKPKKGLRSTKIIKRRKSKVKSLN